MYQLMLAVNTKEARAGIFCAIGKPVEDRKAASELILDHPAVYIAAVVRSPGVFAKDLTSGELYQYSAYPGEFAANGWDTAMDFDAAETNRNPVDGLAFDKSESSTT